MQAEASQMAASSQLTEAQEQALDEYPMPDAVSYTHLDVYKRQAQEAITIWLPEMQFSLIGI